MIRKYTLICHIATNFDIDLEILGLASSSLHICFNTQVWPDNKTAFPDFLRNNTWNQWKEWIVNQSKEIDFDGLWIVGVTHIPSKMGQKIEILCGKLPIFFYLLECVCQTDAR